MVAHYLSCSSMVCLYDGRQFKYLPDTNSRNCLIKSFRYVHQFLLVFCQPFPLISVPIVYDVRWPGPGANRLPSPPPLARSIDLPSHKRLSARTLRRPPETTLAGLITGQERSVSAGHYPGQHPPTGGSPIGGPSPNTQQVSLP